MQTSAARQKEDVRKVGYVVVTADRGLCGAYNINLIRTVDEAIERDDRGLENGIITVGKG